MSYTGMKAYISIRLGLTYAYKMEASYLIDKTVEKPSMISSYRLIGVNIYYSNLIKVL